MSKRRKGLITASITICFWSLTMIWSKVLLQDSFEPFSLLITRFALSYLGLWIIRPKILRFYGWKRELPYIFAGAFGVTLYFLCEYEALTFTTASNVGILTSVSPILAALIAWPLYKEKPKRTFVFGFIAALIGVVLVVTNGEMNLDFNVAGTVFCLVAALFWAIYTLSIRETGKVPEGEPPDMLVVTRRIFFWGLITMLPLLPVFGYHVNIEQFLQPINIVCLCCSVLLASITAYVTWNIALKALGVIQASIFILAIPALTLFFSVLLLGESPTAFALVGVVFIIVGLFVSQFTKDDLRSHKEADQEVEGN